MIVTLLVDQPWDNFREAYDIRGRSIDALLLIKFASAGLMAAILVVIVGAVEFYDRIRSKQRR